MKKLFLGKNSLLNKIEGCFFDLLFPPVCVGCGAEGELLCDSCFKLISHQSLQTCPICEQTITLSGEVCRQCKSKNNPPLDKLIVASSYDDKLLVKAIHFYKYKFAHELAVPLGKILEKALARHETRIPDVIVPIPLHPRRLRWRGFNQAQLLAQQLGENLAPPLSIAVKNNVIVRAKYTNPQMKVKNYRSRFENIAGAFSVNPGENSSLIRKNHVLLVDDVCTTGATIMECAKELRKLGPKSITAVVLARQG